MRREVRQRKKTFTFGRGRGGWEAACTCMIIGQPRRGSEKKEEEPPDTGGMFERLDVRSTHWEIRGSATTSLPEQEAEIAQVQYGVQIKHSIL